MTERSLTPSAIAFGLSEVALEGCKKKNKNTMLEHGFNTQLYTFPSVFIQKVNFLRMLAVLYLFFLPFVAAQFVRGDFSTHFAVKLGAEEGHAKAQLKRDPLVFSVKG